MKHYKSALFGISDCQYSNARIKIDNISVENILTTKKLLIETLIEQTKAVVIGENEDEFEKIKCFFLGISDYQDSDRTNKINGFAPQYSSTSVLL